MGVVIMLKRLSSGLVMLSFMAFLPGCAATDAALTGSQLDVETKMSSSIFLDPVAPEKRTILVQVRNTSGQPNLNIDTMIRSTLEQKGYQLVEDPAKAQYLLQANVLQVGEAQDKESVDKALSSGFGGALTGGLVGTGIGALAGGHRDAMVGGALAGAAIGYLANTLVKEKTFSMVTDIQISERVTGVVSGSSQHHLKQGTSGSTTNVRHEEGQWQRYQTRVVSTAHQVNLTVQEATAGVSKGLAESIAGIF